MREQIKVAKNEGLNWQTLLIEDAQTDIKLAIKNAVLANEKKLVTSRKIQKIIADAVRDIEIIELKVKTREALTRYADELYRETKRRIGVAPYAMLLGILARTNATTRRKKIKAEQAIEKAVPYIEHGLPLQIYTDEYIDLVHGVFDGLASHEVKEYDSPVSLRNIAEMTVRYERHEEELRELRESGVNLVWTSTHANCSERCEPWQGKLYSLDGTYGTIDGIRYQPLENATDIYYTTKRGKTYKNGIISGFNCRHFLIPYKKGNKPIHVDAKTIDKQREIDKQQRYLERGVRSYRDKAVVFKGVDNRLYRRYKAKAKEWNARYIAYSRENKAAYYPSRTQIFD